MPETRGFVYTQSQPRDTPEHDLDLSALGAMLLLQTARFAVSINHRQCNDYVGERALQAFITESMQGGVGATAGGGDTDAERILREVRIEIR